jgi:hypothetical protein
MRSVPKAPGLQKKQEVASVEVKTPMYKGKSKAVKEDKVERPPIPVSGKGGPPSFSRAGGRFGHGGWKSRSNKGLGPSLAKTSEQEEESRRKQAQMALKKKAVGKRLTSLKQGPNEKQSQLLGE